MKRKFSAGMFLCLTSILTGIPTIHGAAPPLRLAVTEFSYGAKTESLRKEAGTLGDLLTSRLSREAQFQLVERVALDRVLKEKALSLSGLVKPEQAVQVGKLVKADWLCLPSFQNIGGTNYAFAKIVDVNSGAIRDITSVALQRTNLVATAEALATFLISSRSYVQTPKDRVFVAFGAFQNLGINSRYAGFGERLRAAMARRFQGSRIAVVERSQVTPLLNELRLAVGGLTQASGKAASIQPAFFIVDGYYQSFYDTESKINIVLCIETPGNRKQTFSIKELPEAVESKIAACIQIALTNIASVSVSQRDEARVQLRRGSGFVGFVSPTAVWPPAGMPVLDNSPRRKQALKDAISAFESALLLDPEYVTAKQYLARCLADPNIDQLERARDLWREVIATTTNAAQMKVARREFAKSYTEVDDRQAIELLSALQSESTNATEIASYDRDLQLAYRRIGTRVPTQQKLDFAVESWRRKLRSLEQDALQNGRIHVYTSFRAGEWYQVHSAVEGDRPAKVAQVGTVASNLMAEFPRLQPYLLGGFIEWSVGNIPSGSREGVWEAISAPWKAQYEEVLSECEKGTNRIFLEPTFYVDSLWRDLQMFVRHKELGTAERLANLLQKNGRQYFARAGLDELDLYTGYFLFQRESWAEAAAVFDRVGNREIRTSLAGPWGKGGVASARVAADVCRQRLAGSGAAQAAASEPEMIPAPKPVKAFRGQEFIFKCEDSKLWVADGVSLLEFNPDSGEVSRFALPVTPSEMNSSSSFASMIIAGGKLWIGTHRDGLIAFDPFSRRLTNYTVDSGLMMNGVAALHVHQDRLWIGYGSGVGYYDLRDRRFVGMMNELPVALGGGPSSIVTSNQSREAAAPRASFHAFATGPSDTLWAATLWGGLFSFDAKSNRWNSATLPCRFQSASLGITGNFLVVPCYEPTSWTDRDTEFGGLLIYDSAKRDCKRLGVGNGLPGNYLRSVAVDGTKAWVGGRGFVALVDLPAAKVEKVCNLKTDARVRSIEVNGNSLWFCAGPALYRLSRDGHNVDTTPAVASAPRPAGQPEEIKDEAAQLMSDLKAARALTVEQSELRRVYGNTDSEEYKALGDKFRGLVRKVAETFPSVDLNTNKFFTIVLNQRGGQFDGFRFRNNSSEVQNFGWVFAFEEPRSMGMWGVLSRESQPVVCSFIGGEPRLIYTNAPWSQKNVFFERTQSIRNKSILPGQEYILWFSFGNARPNTIHFFCSLFPATQELNSAELDKAFGLKGDSRYPAPFTTREFIRSGPNDGE